MININKDYFQINMSFIFKIFVWAIIVTSISMIIFAGELKQTIYDPFNRSIALKQGQYSGGTSSPPGTNVIITQLFSDFINGYNAASLSDQNKEPYCRYGGQYKYNLYNNPEHGGIYNQTNNLYYCKTTLDLINQIKIPLLWQNNNLVLYCNDGDLINFKNQNLDFLTSVIGGLYKGCIVKNLDLNDNNTIFYGLTVGDYRVDSDKTYKFDPKNNVFSDDITNNDYLVNYNNNNNSDMYIIKNFKENLDTPITNIFSNIPNNFGISRISLFRKYKNSNREIYGYETAAKIAQKNAKNIIKSVYKINFKNFNYINKICLSSLSYYKAKILTSYPINPNDEVICNNNQIIINSNVIDKDKPAKTSLKLFKNIILNLN